MQTKLEAKDIVVIVIVICATVLLALGIDHVCSSILLAASMAYLGKEVFTDRGGKKKPK